mgnify:CR=1 FL=1
MGPFEKNGIPGQAAFWDREIRDTRRVMAYEHSRQVLKPFGFDLQPFAITKPSDLVVRGRNFDWFPKPVRELDADDDFVVACHQAITAARKAHAPLTDWHVYYPMPRKRWLQAFRDSVAESTAFLSRNLVLAAPIAAGALATVVGASVAALGASIAGAFSLASAAPVVLLALHDPVLCAVPAVQGSPSDLAFHIQVVRWE